MNITALTPLQEDFVDNYVGAMTRALILTDVVCVAETGAGKTLAYGIPLVEYIRGRPQIRKMPFRRQIAEPLAIILAPTRELAIEIHGTLLDLCWTEKVRCGLVYGGALMEAQSQKLSEGCDILVATPGRLLALMRQSVRVLGKKQFFSLDQLRFVVLDEADELLSLDKDNKRSFQEEIDAIEAMLPKDRDEDLHINRWFFSSQYTPEELERAEYLIDPLEDVEYQFVDFDTPDEKHSQRYIRVQQSFIKVEERWDFIKERLAYMRDTFFPEFDSNSNKGKCLILTRSIDNVDNIDYFINAELNIRCEKLHGKMPQEHREQAMFSFKHGHVSILVATMKLCGRGVNVNGIRDLVFMEMPETLDEYKYCLGRVERVGNDAKSTAFVLNSDMGIMGPSMKAFLKENNQVIPEWLVTDIDSGVDKEPVLKQWGGR